MRWPVSLCIAALAAPAAHGADIGGWMEHRSRAEAQRDDCTGIIAAAARTPRDAAAAADSYYASGMCYLAGAGVARDRVAAQAWLQRAAELDHPLARRALLSLREPTLPENKP